MQHRWIILGLGLLSGAGCTGSPLGLPATPTPEPTLAPSPVPTPTPGTTMAVTSAPVTPTPTAEITPSPTPTPSPSPTPTPSPSPTPALTPRPSPTPGTPTPTPSPSVPPFAVPRIDFPPPHAESDSENVLVRGSWTGTPPIAVSALTVAGVPATSEDGFETWQALVPLGAEDIMLDVDYEAAGRRFENAAERLLGRDYFLNDTGTFALDAAANVIYAYDDGYFSLFRYEMGSARTSVVSGYGRGSGPALPAAASRDLTLSGDGRAFVGFSDRIVEIDLESGARSLLVEDLEDLGGFWLNDADDHLFLAHRAPRAGISVLDLASGEHRLLSGTAPPFEGPASEGEGAPLGNAEDVVLDAPRNRLLVLDSAQRHIVAIDLDTGHRQPFNTTGIEVEQHMTLDAAGERLLLVTDEREIVSYDLHTGQRDVFSDATHNGVRISTGHFGQDISVHPVDGRVFYASLRFLVVVDPQSRARRRLRQGRVGNGADPMFCVDIALGPEGQQLFYGSNDYFSQFNGIFRVDLRSGQSRHLTLSGERPPQLAQIFGIAYDPVGDRLLFSADAAPAALLSADRSGASAHVFHAPPEAESHRWNHFERAGVVDARSHRLYRGSRSARRIDAHDLTTGERTLISGAERGAGPELQDINGVALLPGSDRLVVSDWRHRALLAVDVITGNRSVFSGAEVGAGPALNGPGAVTYDAAKDRLLLCDGGSPVVVDPHTGDRRRLPTQESFGWVGFLHCERVLPMPGYPNVLLANDETFGIFAIDELTGHRVLLAH